MISKESPKKMQKLVMDLRVLGQPAQSESQNPFNCKVVADRKNKPWPGVSFKYWRTLCVACKCGRRDSNMN